MDSKAEQLEKKKRPKMEGQVPEIAPDLKRTEVFGEVQLKPSEETALLAEIQRLKKEAEEREVKEKRPSAGLVQDDQALAGVSAVPQDDEDKPIEYYGYKIPKEAMDTIADEIKMKLNLSATWRAVLLTRLLQMS